MIRSRLARAFALLAVVGGTATRGSAQQIPTDEAISAILEQRIAEGRAVGLVVGVLEADGSTRIIHAGSAGRDAQLNETTLFEIGSITKAFTGALLAEMDRRGEVSLNDPVARYLPDGVRVPSRGGREITLLDLATHRSGLPRLPANMAPADGQNPYADYSIEQLYAFLSTYELPRDIGAVTEYSNLGAGLLGHALARAVGTSYEEALRARILEPLGMRSTAVTLGDALRARMASGHNSALQPVPLWDIPALAGAGALRADVRDLLRWIGANVGEPADELGLALRRAHEPRAALGPDGSSGPSIGLNWIILSSGGRRIVWHNGGTGGFFSWAGFDPDRRIGLVVLSNAGHAVDDIALHLLDPSNPLSERPRRRTQVQVAPEVLRQYVGEYELAPNLFITVTFEDDDALFMQPTGQARLPIFAESETHFFLRVVDAQITFQHDSAGAVTGLLLHQGGRTTPGRRVR